MIARRVGTILSAAALVVGTFLPWVSSGRISRDSYAVGGLLRRVGEFPSGAGWVMDVWQFVPLLCAIGAALVLLDRPLLGALPAVVGAALGGSVAGVVLADGGNSLIRPVSIGPIVTLVGSCAFLVTVMISIVGAEGPRR